MKHLSISLNLRRFRLSGRRFWTEYPRDGRLTLYLLIVCFCAGLAMGALLVRGDPDLQSKTAEYLATYLEIRSSGFWRVFLVSFGCSFLFLFLAFLSGMFIPGCVTSPLILFGRGVLFGLLSGALYRNGLLSGMMQNLAIFMPSAVFATMVLLLAVRETIGFSTALFRADILEKEKEMNHGFRLYCTRYLILLGLLVLPAILDAGLAQFI